MKDFEAYHHHNPLFVSACAVVILVLMNFIEGSTVVAATDVEVTKKIDPYMITTRERLNYEGIQEPGYNNSYSFLEINQLTKQRCPEEFVIFVHGWGDDEEKAKERFDRVKLSLENNSYAHPLVGLSWDSDQAWFSAKFVAKDNGLQLANFIVNTKVTCKHLEPDKNVKIRLIAHSLGARVVLSALDNLHKDSIWNNSTNNFNVTSIHLMGAAVDDEEVSMYPRDILNDLTNWGSPKSDYGKAIQEEVIKFYNLFSTKDNALEPNFTNPFYPSQIYPSFEADRALGQSGYQKFPHDLNATKSLPRNYKQTVVQNEIRAICDADGDRKSDFLPLTNITIELGDNHGGYLGFRNNTRLIDDGAMNLVVDDWNNVASGININENLQSIVTCT
jgi:pimeloyl-ACP methyl ester carboxylesterase